MSVNELDKFLKHWRKELSDESESKPPSAISKRKCDSLGHIRVKQAVKSSKHSNLESTSEQVVPVTFSYVDGLRNEDDENGCLQKITSNVISSGGKMLKDSTAGIALKLQPESEKLVDVLLADLDEINEIPFFALTVPREVAMKIFQHFDLVDLCRCAQVSKSWKSMAEDELLWCRICHKLGYEEDSLTAENHDWKLLAREFYMREKRLEHNWKNRIGRYEALSYVPGGILCAADSHAPLVAGGYTNGQVCLWDIESGIEAIYRPSSMSLMIDEALDRGTMANELTDVRLGKGVAAALYSQGIVDVWHLDGDVNPVHTSRANAKQSYVCCHKKRPITAYSFDRTVHMIEIGRSQFSEATAESVKTAHCPEYSAMTLNTTQFGQNVYWLKFVPEADQLLCVQTGHVIRLVAPSITRENLPVVHELVDSMIACADVDEDRLCVGVTSYGLLDGCKIQVYELLTGRLVTSLEGIGDMGLTCMNVTDSPDNMLVSGGRDRKVYIHDFRQTAPVSTLYPDFSVSCVQMDGHKVVVSGHDGHTCVYDTRTGHKLWQLHNRHPVVYSRFDKHRLVTANVPQCKVNEEEQSTDNMTHKRYRGGIHMYDFSVTNETEGVPTICKSGYDCRSGYSYNISLTVPYDNL